MAAFSDLQAFPSKEGSHLGHMILETRKFYQHLVHYRISMIKLAIDIKVTEIEGTPFVEKFPSFAVVASNLWVNLSTSV